MVQKEERRVVFHSDQTKPRRSTTRRRPVEEGIPTVLVGGAWRVLGFPVWSRESFKGLVVNSLWSLAFAVPFYCNI
ncbi:hypothetical protein Bca52824_092850 [Brassica carinata]|uniref:Uncharacterized protein n=1 Tax=Brassica carinata TaxID=52824 RepID=A0A8X7TLC1_BRACI|nr:hypothetical protein Bca52824_092850 [Brassica carinata]